MKQFHRSRWEYLTFFFHSGCLRLPQGQIRPKAAILTPLQLIFASVFYMYYTLSFSSSPVEILRPLLIFWLVILLLFGPACRLIRDRNWAGLLLVVIVLGFFSSERFALAYCVTALSVIGTLWLSFRLLFKRRLTLQHVFLVLNVVTLMTVLLLSWRLHSNFGTIPVSYFQNTWEVVKGKRYVELDAGTFSKPDIYYIVLDGYSRADILRLMYGVDNSSFITYLEGKGFIVPEHSLANYSKTALSVPSTLNIDYIQSFAPGLHDSIAWWLMSPWLDHNLVRTSLERIGYTSVSVSTDWSITDNPTTDNYLKSRPVVLSEYEKYILAATPLRMIDPLIQDIANTPEYRSYRSGQLNNFQALIRGTAIPGPKFVFAHVLLTHPPFVFTAKGTPITPNYGFSLYDGNNYPGTPEEYKQLYSGQLQFLNGQLEEVIDAIMENSKEPPIIILQADHGSGLFTDFDSIENTCLPGRFSVFAAYYLPGIDRAKIPDDITPVNLFRIIFNEDFDTNLPLLKNAYYSPSHEPAIYNLVDVSKDVNNVDNCYGD